MLSYCELTWLLVDVGAFIWRVALIQCSIWCELSGILSFGELLWVQVSSNSSGFGCILLGCELHIFIFCIPLKANFLSYSVVLW